MCLNRRDLSCPVSLLRFSLSVWCTLIVFTFPNEWEGGLRCFHVGFLVSLKLFKDGLICLLPFLILSIDVITNLIHEPIWNLLSPYNLCNSPSHLRNWPPPLRNLHRNYGLETANLPMLVYRSPLAGLMMHFTVYHERMRSLRSSFPLKPCSS